MFVTTLLQTCLFVNIFIYLCVIKNPTYEKSVYFWLKIGQENGLPTVNLTLKRLSTNLMHGVNTILISPRRWGKTSLVQ